MSAWDGTRIKHTHTHKTVVVCGFCVDFTHFVTGYGSAEVHGVGVYGGRVEIDNISASDDVQSACAVVSKPSVSICIACVLLDDGGRRGSC